MLNICKCTPVEEHEQAHQRSSALANTPFKICHYKWGVTRFRVLHLGHHGAVIP